MSRIKFFKDSHIAVYIYGEKNDKHHGKHLLVLKVDESCQYGFDGEPLACSKPLKSQKERKLVREWILSHQQELEKAWEDVNNGIKPQVLEKEEKK